VLQGLVVGERVVLMPIKTVWSLIG